MVRKVASLVTNGTADRVIRMVFLSENKWGDLERIWINIRNVKVESHLVKEERMDTNNE